MTAQLHNVDQHIENTEGMLQQLTNVVVLTALQDARLNAVILPRERPGFRFRRVTLGAGLTRW